MEDQERIDAYWEAMSEQADMESEKVRAALESAICNCNEFCMADNRDRCGWCKLSWSIIDLDNEDDLAICKDCMEEIDEG